MQTHTLSSLCMIMAGAIIVVSCKKTEKIAENVLNRNHVSPTFFDCGEDEPEYSFTVPLVKYKF